MERWKTERLSNTYLKGVRGAIPLAADQIEIILRVIKKLKPGMRRFLDLGCGDGILGRTLLAEFPRSEGILLDFSEPMIKAARTKCREYENRVEFVIQDLSSSSWADSLNEYLPFDLVISGFAIHHLDNESKKRVFEDVFNKLLKPGGIFLNLDQVASSSEELVQVFDEYFLDKVSEFNNKSGLGLSLKDIEAEYYKDKNVNILMSVEDQLKYLSKIGFINTDCYFKVLELALFGGVKPD
jgi:ubiquinone/menaquinone biosynthesis C-methylase UbiE